MSLLARAVTATAAGGISSGARVIAAVVVIGHGLILSMLGGDLGVGLTPRGRGGRSGRGHVHGFPATSVPLDYMISVCEIDDFPDSTHCQHKPFLNPSTFFLRIIVDAILHLAKDKKRAQHVREINVGVVFI